MEEVSETFLQHFPFTLLLLAVSLILVLYKWSSTTSTENSPPSPPKLPIIGNLHQLGIFPHRSLTDLSETYGPDFMLLHFGTFPVLVVSSADAARQIFKTNDVIFSNRTKNTIFAKLFYQYKDVAAAPYGEYWRQVRFVCVSKLLSNKRVRSFRSVRQEETRAIVDRIKQYSASFKAVNLSEMFVKITNDVVCQVALGKKFTGDGEGARKFKNLLSEFSVLLGCRDIGDYIPWMSWLSRVNGLHAKLENTAKQFDVFLDSVIREHIEERSKSTGNDQNEEQMNFVDVLLQIQKEDLLGFPIDNVSIKAIILDMFAAGTDTTYTVIEWAMSELIKHPRVMKKLQNEIRGIVGDKGEVTEDDLVKMPYLKAVFKESLRVHPPIPLLLPRMSNQDVELSGYKIKANTQVIINAWKIGRDLKSYEKPEEFEPERFLSNNSIDYKGNDFQLLPFGAGRRVCPGIQFGMAVTELFLANIVYKFDWTLPGGVTNEDLDMTESAGLTIHRKNPLEAVPIPYSC